MSVASTFAPSRADNPRWLLLGSLALNLFFIGIAAAYFLRPPGPIDRSIATRIERISATLPSANANILRNAYQANRAAVDGARAGFESARDGIRAALRHEPFDVNAMRAAMKQTRDARQIFDQVLQNTVANAASEMSQAGRNGLADWPPGSQPNNKR
jgi:uncharacterized membrane protein